VRGATTEKIDWKSTGISFIYFSIANNARQTDVEIVQVLHGRLLEATPEHILEHTTFGAQTELARSARNRISGLNTFLVRNDGLGHRLGQPPSASVMRQDAQPVRLIVSRVVHLRHLGRRNETLEYVGTCLELRSQATQGVRLTSRHRLARTDDALHPQPKRGVKLGTQNVSGNQRC